jgi:hypothetical protein
MAIGGIVTAAFALAWGLAGTRVPAVRLIGVALVAFAAIRLPPLAAMAGVVAVVLGIQRTLRWRSHRDERAKGDVATLAELTVLGLAGGLGAQSALDLAATTLGGPVGDEARVVLRRMRVDGVAGAATATGHGRALYRVIARTAATGAPLLDPVSRLAGELHEDLASSRLETVRRLPVVTLFPLTLLILPGFLLLTVAPALLEAFGRLEI